MLKFWSQIGLFVQIAIVVAAVVLFNLFDPFGWLNTKKLTLEDTPISVRSIREVGKLITAEYYGEVLTSLQESILEEIKEDIQGDSAALKQVEEQFFEAIRDLRERKRTIKLRGINKRKKLYNLFYRDYSVTSHPFYQSYIDYILEKSEDYKKEKKLLKSLYDAEDDDLEGMLTALKVDALDALMNKVKEDAKTVTGNKKFKKSQIVVLGRGWVKAGIDFESFNENNFKYDKATKTIHLVGMKPQILYSTINPWFIPEKQIKGFEVILITKRANKPEYMHKVKSRSLKKLRQQAIQSGILKQAKKNAEDNLKSFFSLLLPEGIDEVIIHDDFFSYFDASFVSDTLTAETMQSVDSLFMSRYRTDSMAVISLRDTLYQKRVQLPKATYPVSRYSSRLAMAEDGILSDGEMKWLKLEKSSLAAFASELSSPKGAANYSPHRLDSIWFFPEKSIVAALRKKVNDTSTVRFSWSKVISDHPDYLKDQQRRKEAVKRAVYRLMIQRKQSAFEALEVALTGNVTQVVKDGTTFSTEDEIPEDSVDSTFQKVNDLNTLVDSDLREQTLHTWQISEKETVTLEAFEKMSEILEANWYIDKQSVITRRNEVLSDWKIEIDSQRIIPATRFATYFHYLEKRDSVFGADVAIVDRNRMIEISNYLNNVKLKDQELDVLIDINDTLSQIFYYPPPEAFVAFEKKVKDRWYWASGKRKKELKKIYREQLIQKHILEQKQTEFEDMLTLLLKSTKSIKLKDTLAVKETKKEIKIEALNFLENYRLK